MATQTQYVTDLQAMNPTTVLNVQQSVAKSTTNTIQGSQQGQKSQTTTIIQPSQAHSAQQFIVTTTMSGEQVGDQNQESVTLQQGGQTVYPTHVQYVDSNDPALYASTNGQMYDLPEGVEIDVPQSIFPVKIEPSSVSEIPTVTKELTINGKVTRQTTYQTDYGQTMYTPVSGTYYQTSGAAQVAATGLTQVQTVQGQLLQHQSGTYLIQGGTMDGEGTPLTHTTRASPVTVQWLIDNYETAEGVSLPRSTLYNHYLRHCQEQNLDPMNPASFGKLIRSVFLGLRTRRLGTRGNSKYHYYGIRIKANSPLNQFTDDQTMAMRQQPMYQGKKFKMEGDNESGYTHTGTPDPATAQQQQHQQFLGDASGAIPHFEDIDTTEPFPEGVTIEHVKSFEKMYREHAEAIVDVVVNLQFSLIEALWQGFWRNQPADQLTADNDYEKRLPKEKLYLVSKYEPAQKFVRLSDYAFYQALVEVLIPDVLRPIPSSLTQAIRNFAKSLENWLKGAMTGVPDEMVKTKIAAVSAFAQTLRRYTSLNHLAQAARAVLQNTSQINQMLTDLNRVDFANVQEQASWVCQCEDTVVTQLQEDFKKTLECQNSLEQWAEWLEEVVNQVLKPHEGSDTFPKAARQFLLKWSFYSSMVIRDLTLRSAASFGSFHLIRLLYDEYMFYLIEHKVAAATGETPIAVMGEVRQFIDLSSAVMLSSLDSTSDAKSPAVIKTTNANTTVLNKAMETTTSANTATLMVLNSAGQNVNGNLIAPGTSAVSVRSSTPGSNPSTVTVRPASIPGSGNITMASATNPTTVTVRAAPGTVPGNGNIITPTQGLNPTTVTVRAANSAAIPGAKTIVVMPVSNSLSSGDGQNVKRLKVE